jgi:hypothetical protein
MEKLNRIKSLFSTKHPAGDRIREDIYYSHGRVSRSAQSGQENTKKKREKTAKLGQENKITFGEEQRSERGERYESQAKRKQRRAEIGDKI